MATNSVIAKTHHSNERIVSQTYNTTQKGPTMKMEFEMDTHVSHRMGNSLCSHPALLISAFGILTRRWKGKLGKGRWRSTGKTARWLAKPESSTLSFCITWVKVPAEVSRNANSLVLLVVLLSSTQDNSFEFVGNIDCICCYN
jgi:hypothetical protein